MRKILPTILLLMLCISSYSVFSGVVCHQVNAFLKQELITEAHHLIKKKQANPLCAFYIAWYFKNEHDKARAYMMPIQNMLDPQESFYYKALYLKLLLIDDLPARQIRQNLHQLKFNDRTLANRLIRNRKKTIQNKLFQLLRNPFGVKITPTIGFWWSQFPQIKSQFDKISHSVSLIQKNYHLPISKAHSKTIVTEFYQLRKAGARFTENDSEFRDVHYCYTQCSIDNKQACQQILSIPASIGRWNITRLHNKLNPVSMQKKTPIPLKYGHRFEQMLTKYALLNTTFLILLDDHKTTFFAKGMLAIRRDTWKPHESSHLERAIDIFKKGRHDRQQVLRQATEELSRFIETLTIKDESLQRGSKLNQAYFNQAFFLGLWYLDQGQFEKSQDIICHGYAYKYTLEMNAFDKTFIQAIAEEGGLSTKTCQ